MKMTLFGNAKPVKLLLFVRNFNIKIELPGTITVSMKLQYLRTLLHGMVPLSV